MQTTIAIDRKDLFALGALCLFCLYLFRDIVFSGHLLVGKDFVAFYLGMKSFLYNEVRLHHEIPYWNPYIFGGMPFWAHFESTIFYPLGFLFYLLSPEVAYGYTMLLHLALAGVFMYILSRSLGTGRAGSFLASAVYMCNGFIMATLFLGHMCPAQSYIWLPLIIYFLNRAVRTGISFLSILPAGVLWGVQILAGAPQDAFYTFLASTLFLLCHMESGKQSGASIRKILLAVPMVFVVGAGIASIQLVPAFELVGESVRASLNSFEMITQTSYPPEGLITTLLPNFFGNYAKGGFWVDNVPLSVPYQNLYVGILPLMSLCFISYRNSDRKRVILFALILAAAALLLALGRHTPIYKLAYLFPGFDKFRTPARILTLWVFAVALLGGKGFESLIERIRNHHTRRSTLLAVFAVILLLIDLLLHFNRPLILKLFSPFIVHEAIPNQMSYATEVIYGEFHRFTLLALFSFLCLLLMRCGLIRSGFGAISLCAFLLVDLGLANSGGITRDVEWYSRIEKFKKGLDASIGLDNSIYRVGAYSIRLGPNLEMFLGYQTVGGYTALIPTRYYEYINKYADGKLPEGWANFHYGAAKNSILMDLLNVKYAVSHQYGIVEQRKSHLPRAFIVPGHELVEKDRILNRLTDPAFNPRRTVFLDKEEVSPHLSLDALYPSSPPGVANITKYRPDQITIETESSGPAFLFLSEIFYPGWKATLDGQPASILRGNYLFRVVEVPGGRHTIDVFFDPLSIKLGIWGTLLTLFILFGITARHCWEKGLFRQG